MNETFILALAKPGYKSWKEEPRSEYKERHKPLRIVSVRLKLLQRGAFPTMTRAIRRLIGLSSEQEDGLVPQPHHSLNK